MQEGILYGDPHDSPLLIPLQLLSGDFHFLRGFQPQVLLHDGDKVLLMPQNIAGDQLNVPQNQMVQNLFPDEVGTALFLVLPMQRTLEEGAFRLVIVGCAVVELFPTVRTEYQAGEHTGSAGFCFAVSLFPNLLNLLEYLF